MAAKNERKIEAIVRQAAEKECRARRTKNEALASSNVQKEKTGRTAPSHATKNLPAKQPKANLIDIPIAKPNPFLVGTPGQIAAAQVGASVGEAIASGIELANTKGHANAQFAAARKRFFAEFPDGPGFAKAHESFSALLWEKDLYFLWINLPTGYKDNSRKSMARVFEAIDVLTGGTLDNGIQTDAEFAFSRWVTGVRQSLGAESLRDRLKRLPNADQLASALEANADRYAAYKRDRDLAEFDAQCRAVPGPYCPTTGLNGDVVLAEKVGTLYIERFANRMNEGGKARLRDAIVDFETVAYSTTDCVNSVSRNLENDGRHDVSLASMRKAVKRYEASGAIKPHDACLFAVQDMQREELKRNGTPDVPSVAKLLWDYRFRVDKFNQVHGPLTDQQASQLVQRNHRMQVDADYFKRRSTVIDYLALGESRETSASRSYERVRQSLIKEVITP